MFEGTGKVVCELRGNMTQAEFAKKVGLSRPYISQIENAERTPRVDTFERILNAFGCTLMVVNITEVRCG